MTGWQRTIGAVGIVACFGVAASWALGQEPAPSESVTIPATATELEGIPTVRIDSTEDGTTRRALGEAEATRERLVIRLVDGEFYWASRDNRRLEWSSSGEFTYLSSSPGQYIRLRRINDTISYVEHVERADGSVTWWGELRVVLGR